jgi:CBS-domain-containing membrane protein
MDARDIMTRAVVTAAPEAGVQEAARLLADHNIGGMPVVDAEGRAVGVVTASDLLARDGRIVAALMTARVIAVAEDTPVDQIAQILTGNHIKRVPVLRDGRVVGIVSRADLVRLLASPWRCPACGAIARGRAPDACPSCGLDGGRFERALHLRPEITTRQ